MFCYCSKFFDTSPLFLSMYLNSSQSLSNSLSKSLRLGLVIPSILCHTVPSIVIPALSSCIQCHRRYLSSSQLSHHNTSALQCSSPSNVADITLCLLSLSEVLEDFIKSLSPLSTLILNLSFLLSNTRSVFGLFCNLASLSL